MTQRQHPENDDRNPDSAIEAEIEESAKTDAANADTDDSAEFDAVDTEPNQTGEEFAALSHEELIDKLSESLDQITEMKDGYLRARAEMENVRRRAENEVSTARKFAIESFAAELLNVLDSLDQASKVELDEGAGDAVVKMKEGLELTLKQFDTVMGKFSVTEVEAGPGVKFDPDHHQAISMIPTTDVPADHIVDVVQKGYLLKERLLRPAMVVVSNS
ncbi:MAG: nucleotide exchange factor GrpE [Pseudomonadota bacterium]